MSCGSPTVNSNTVQSGNGTLYGDTVTFSCASGYVIVNGSEAIVCKSDGQWNDSALYCQRRDCGKPDKEPNTSFTTTTTVYEGTANYSCDAGYEPSGGNLTRVCGAEGNWSGSALGCQSKLNVIH